MLIPRAWHPDGTLREVANGGETAISSPPGNHAPLHWGEVLGFVDDDMAITPRFGCTGKFTDGDPRFGDRVEVFDVQEFKRTLADAAPPDSDE